MHPRTIIRLALALLASLVVCGGCQPYQPSPAAPAPAVGPGSILVAGDSLTIQARTHLNDGPVIPWVVAGVGWKGSDVLRPPGGLSAGDVAARGGADRVVIALGNNEATDGWDHGDAEALRAIATLPGVRCVVWLLPTWGPSFTRKAQLQDVRTGMANLSREPRAATSVVADWRSTTSVHPEFIGPDGLHLPEQQPGLATDAAAAARTAAYQAGADRCPA